MPGAKYDMNWGEGGGGMPLREKERLVTFLRGEIMYELRRITIWAGWVRRNSGFGLRDHIAPELY